MATEGWFPQWFTDTWFPPVWFAPADEVAVSQPPTSGGGYGYLPEKKPRRDTDDDLLMCFLL